MASLEGGEKQLFEKFWQGTFKAVATPRPGSVIVASITSRKPWAREGVCTGSTAATKLPPVVISWERQAQLSVAATSWPVITPWIHSS
ncbi:hypothetical protein JRQ81_007656 [Phrynocephalus forsythii]|uniref:Uncharacterized protein n=1 Tax=Phrynocephalus forsythii TaxID=171643 RepID=A0A9Q0XCH6_9SAUR|nr:hypothetical protein JRQ81_007656 [Phrynocephalus forsythii]